MKAPLFSNSLHMLPKYLVMKVTAALVIILKDTFGPFFSLPNLFSVHIYWHLPTKSLQKTSWTKVHLEIWTLSNEAQPPMASDMTYERLQLAKRMI